jgi:hypothetical protein
MGYAADLGVVQRYMGDNIILENTGFGVDTDIVSIGAIVETPTGDTLILEPTTDIFSPSVDFITHFRYGGRIEGPPISGEPYTFTLLDPLGNPIEGTTLIDVWTECTIGPPRDLVATLIPSTTGPSINLSWPAISSAPGWDPPSGVGFYHLVIDDYHLSEDSLFGSEMQANVHIIPWNGFGGEAPGNPDGFDYGIGLGEFPDATYKILVGAFTFPTNPQGVPLECNIAANDEILVFVKNGTTITFITPPTP